MKATIILLTALALGLVLYNGPETPEDASQLTTIGLCAYFMGSLITYALTEVSNENIRSTNSNEGSRTYVVNIIQEKLFEATPAKETTKKIAIKTAPIIFGLSGLRSAIAIDGFV